MIAVNDDGWLSLRPQAVKLAATNKKTRYFIKYCQQTQKEGHT